MAESIVAWGKGPDRQRNPAAPPGVCPQRALRHRTPGRPGPISLELVRDYRLSHCTWEFSLASVSSVDFRKRSLIQAVEELDQLAVDGFGGFLLSPVADAGKHDGLLEVGDA